MPNVEFLSYKTVSLFALFATQFTSISDRHVCWQSLISNYLVPIVSYISCIFFYRCFYKFMQWETQRIYAKSICYNIYFYYVSLYFLFYSHTQQ